MRVVVTGQVGLDKKPFLKHVAEIAREQGYDLKICNIGQMMYAEAPDVAPGKILDLPLSRLRSLRRSVFRDVLATCKNHPNVLVNTHATFRWRHGLFYAFDYDHMEALDAEIYLVLVDNIDRVHSRLIRDGHVDHTLKDLAVWREEEILATELFCQIFRRHGRFYIMPRGTDDSTADALVKLLFRPEIKRAYLSFPMSHVGDWPQVVAQIDSFRREMKRHLVCFDPNDLDEKSLCKLALAAAEAGHRTIEVTNGDLRATLDTNQILDIIADIDGQIYARDFKLIDQAEMIISLIPQMPDGRPVISSGVERELQHAHEATRDVFVIWTPEVAPSPFVTETATRLFSSVAEALKFFLENDYIPSPTAGGLFG